MYSLLLILWLTISNCGVSPTKFNSLSGRHLRVIWAPWNGNPKGLLGPLKGGVALDFLSARLNFTYEMVRVTGNSLLPQTNERGLFSYLWDQQCDLILQDVLPLFYRRHIDMTTPWTFTYYTLLIPVDGDTANIDAVIKPFQWPVWVGLGISILCVMTSMILSLCFFPHLPTTSNSNGQALTTRRNRRSQNRIGSLPIAKELFGKHYLYVIGTLLSQENNGVVITVLGGLCLSKRLPVRLVAGVWCLAAFIFVQAYSSILFTYIVTPVNLPLVNSVYDTFQHSDIRLLLRKGVTLEVLASGPNRTGLFFKLGNKLNSYPDSRCISEPECANQIKPGLRNVFAHPINYLKDIIKEDFQLTGKCKLQIAKESFMPTRSSFALQQNSPYTKSVDQGILELQQTGLIDFWDSWFRPMPPQCNGDAPSKKQRNKLSSLSFKNLTGAFLLLAVGLILSILFFLFEKIYFRLSA